MTDKKFKELYHSLGIFDEKGEELPLYQHCKHSNDCWLKALGRKQKDHNSIYRPWIGKDYNKARLLVIGLNLNNYGGYDASRELFEQAKREISEGKIKLFKNERYVGSIVFHRFGSYVTSILEKKGLLKPTWKDSFPLPKDIIDAYDHIAYTNHIKCSPKGDNGKPSTGMWEKCGGHILKQEIKLLTPDIILLLGTSDNYSYFKKNVLDKDVDIEWKMNIGVGEVMINEKPIKIFIIPHPTSRGGNKYEIMNDFNCIVNNRC